MENIQLPSPRGLDEVFERALENILAEDPPLSPSKHDELECPVNQAPPSPIPGSSVQTDLPSANTPSHRTNQRLSEPNRKWKKKDLNTFLPEYILNIGVIEDYFADCSTPTDIFLVLIGDIIDNIVYQNNLYAERQSIKPKKGTSNIYRYEFFNGLQYSFGVERPLLFGT